MSIVIDLTKGQTIDLTKHAPAVSAFYVGLGWPKSIYDLDVSVFPCKYNSDGDPRLLSPPYFIYYNQLRSPCGGIDLLSGDNRQGDKDGDDEFLKIDTSLIDQSIDEIAIIVTTHGAPGNGFNFGKLPGEAYVRICELAPGDQPGREIAKFRLDETARDQCGAHFGSLEKVNGQWQFTAVGDGFVADLGTVVTQYMPEATVKS